jgi:hypothetical protein
LWTKAAEAHATRLLSLLLKFRNVPGFAAVLAGARGAVYKRKYLVMVNGFV